MTLPLTTIQPQYKPQIFSNAKEVICNFDSCICLLTSVNQYIVNQYAFGSPVYLCPQTKTRCGVTKWLDYLFNIQPFKKLSNCIKLPKVGRFKISRMLNKSSILPKASKILLIWLHCYLQCTVQVTPASSWNRNSINLLYNEFLSFPDTRVSVTGLGDF